ncbi:major facilitator superfamily domain-containing protein [Flagelloscypha sp. PMI_526]|nr:major facilitator superfamily domain-containing protein [Flagelloscypha sp. PMI_526]
MTSPSESPSSFPSSPSLSSHDTIEITPLIPNTAIDQAAKPAWPSKLQLAIIFLIRICEAITSIMIYPFVNQFVRSTGIVGDDEKRTGYYAGIIESLFFWAEGATVLIWQLASEKYGRRPVLIIAPLGLGLSMITFGLSNTFLGLVVTRTLQGTFNGDVGVTKTVLAEITDSSNRSDVMSMIPVIWSVGTCLAPFIGGFFSDPVKHWPNVFGKVELLKEHPYLLPCVVSGILCLLTFCLALFGLKETHPPFVDNNRKNSAPNESEIESQSNGSPASSASAPLPSTSRPLVGPSSFLTRDVILLLTVGSLYALCTMMIYALQALIWSTSLKNGGLGFDALTIGSINATFGIPNAILQFLFLGRIMRHLGPRGGLIAGFTLTLLSLTLYPFQTYFAHRSGEVNWQVWFIIVAQLLCNTFMSLGHASLILCAIEVSPGTSSTGMIQGMLQMTSVFMRGVAPTLATSLYAYASESDSLCRFIVYVVLGGINVGAIGLAAALPRA